MLATGRCPIQTIMVVEDMLTVEVCLRKAAEFRAKAAAATDWLVKVGLESVAREFEQRAKKTAESAPSL